jgi:hypothetical protein
MEDARAMKISLICCPRSSQQPGLPIEIFRHRLVQGGFDKVFSDTHSSLILTVAGVAFFVYGIGIASENLQKIAANRIRQILATLSRRPLWGVF